MLKVAVIVGSLVVDMNNFADEDRDLVATFDFSILHGPDAFGVVVEDGVEGGIGYTYENGVFKRPPIPEPTRDELIQAAQAEKNIRINQANSVFLEWQTKLLLNIATDEQKSAVTEWVNYYDSIKSLDITNAPDIDWPEAPPVPEEAQ